MNHRRLTQMTAAVCSLGLAGAVTAPVFASTDAGTDAKAVTEAKAGTDAKA